MPRNWKNRSEEEGFNYWPAFADMAAATCMILVIFWIAGVLELGGSKDEVRKLKEKIARLEKLVGKDLVSENRRLSAALEAQKVANAKLEERISDAEKEKDDAIKAKEKAVAELEELKKKKPTDEPPNIVLKQDESFVFPSLQASVPNEFATRFKEEKKQAVIDALNSSSNIEVIEIIGHTDNVQVGGTSNVDTNLEAVYAGIKKVGDLEFGSNCELGLGRAIAVKAMLDDLLRNLKVGDSGETADGKEGDGLTLEGKKRIAGLTYRTYSAAQLFPTDPTKIGRAEDRRIEIRFTRLRKTTDTKGEHPAESD